MVATPEQEGILYSTCIVYTSNNGFILYSHPHYRHESLAYKEAGQTLFIVSGSGVREGVVFGLPFVNEMPCWASL